MLAGWINLSKFLRGFSSFQRGTASLWAKGLQHFYLSKFEDDPIVAGEGHNELKCQIWHGKYFCGYNTQI